MQDSNTDKPVLRAYKLNKKTATEHHHVSKVDSNAAEFMGLAKILADAGQDDDALVFCDNMSAIAVASELRGEQLEYNLKTHQDYRQSIYLLKDCWMNIVRDFRPSLKIEWMKSHEGQYMKLADEVSWNIRKGQDFMIPHYAKQNNMDWEIK